jgi:hypothetical protein
MVIRLSVSRRLLRILLSVLGIIGVVASGVALERSIWEYATPALGALSIALNPVAFRDDKKGTRYSLEVRLFPELSSLHISERATGLAAFVAGKRRNIGSAWLDDLRGDPEGGDILTPAQRRRKAAGFLVAAVRFRLHDWLGWAWMPVDWMLRTRSRREGFVAAAVGTQAIYIMQTGGLHVLLTDGWAWNAACGGAAWGLTWWLGKRRGIELASDDEPAEK